MKMIRRLTTCFVLLAMASGRVHLAAMNYEHLRSSVVRISSLAQSFDILNPFNEGAASMSVGSGFVVQVSPYPLFATNAHVINDAKQVRLQLLLLGAKQWEAEVVSVCTKFDLALLVIRDSKSFLAATNASNISLRSIKLSENAAMMGQNVVALGFPLGQDSLKFSKGNIAGIGKVNGNMCIQSTAPISPGSSGGPLLNEVGNALVGVNFAKSMAGENINYVVPAFRVAQLMRKHFTDQSEAPGDGKWKRLRASIPDADLTTEEANEALYALSEGCSQGVFVSRVGRRSFLRTAVPPLPSSFFLEAVNGVELDEFGKGLKPDYATDRVDFDDLFFMVSDFSTNVTLRSCREGLSERHTVYLDWKPEYSRGVSYVDEPVLSGLPRAFELFGGVTIMDMTMNHVQQLVSQGYTTCARWLHPDVISTPRLVVSSVQPGTYAASIVSPGSVVTKINSNRVRTLNEFREFFQPAEHAAWTLETDTGRLLVLRFNESLAQQVIEVKASPRHLSKAVGSAAFGRGLVSELPAEGPAGENLEPKAEAQLLQRRDLLAHADDFASDTSAHPQARAAGPRRVNTSVGSELLVTEDSAYMAIRVQSQ